MASAVEPPAPYRTLQARPNSESLVKPGELVDLVEVTPLTLADRRIYNLLLENAWDAIEKPVTHSIAKARLRGSHNSNDRLGDSVERLMRAIVRVRIRVDGATSIERVQLLGGNLEQESADGMLHYEIPARLRRIIRDSVVFARLQREVMFALTSKYALTLYEMVQKRRNLAYRQEEVFELDELRGILGVPPGKLQTWSNLQNRAIRPAVEEVNRLSDCVVAVEPLKRGKRVAAVRLRWAVVEGRGPFAGGSGRAPALEGEIPRRPAPAAGGGLRLRPETLDTARLRHPGYDVHAIEAAWRRWAEGKERPRLPDKAFLAFCRAFVAENPL